LSAFILARSEPFSSYPFLPFFLFSHPQSDLTIPFLCPPFFFPSVSPTFSPPNSYFPLVLTHARCSMPVSNLFFMVILLSYLSPYPPALGFPFACNESPYSSMRFFFTLYSMGRPSAKSSTIFPSPSQVFLPLLVSFVCFFLSVDRSAKLNYASLRTVCVLLVLFFLIFLGWTFWLFSLD
jgi:hypothetical protein